MFLFTTLCRLKLEARPASNPMDTGDYLPGVKWPRHTICSNLRLVPRVKEAGAVLPQKERLSLDNDVNPPFFASYNWQGPTFDLVKEFALYAT
jgi:hypothetical protein